MQDLQKSLNSFSSTNVLFSSVLTCISLLFLKSSVSRLSFNTMLENAGQAYVRFEKSLFMVTFSLDTVITGFWFKYVTRYPYTSSITAKAIECVAIKRITAAPDNSINL